MPKFPDKPNKKRIIYKNSRINQTATDCILEIYENRPRSFRKERQDVRDAAGDGVEVETEEKDSARLVVGREELCVEQLDEEEAVSLDCDQVRQGYNNVVKGRG